MTSKVTTYLDPFSKVLSAEPRKFPCAMCISPEDVRADTDAIPELHSLFFQFCSDDTANSLIDSNLLSGAYPGAGLYLLQYLYQLLFFLDVANDDSRIKFFSYGRWFFDVDVIILFAFKCLPYLASPSRHSCPRRCFCHWPLS